MPALENWLGEAACVIRGPIDAPKYKDYILPLIFMKRLSDIFADELEKLAKLRSPLRTAEAFGVEEMIDPRDTRPLLCEFVEAAQSRLREQLGPKSRPGMRP